MNQNAAHISIVLDRSGSMGSVLDDTIGGFNRFIADQKATPGSATVTLCQFDNHYEVVYSAKPIADVPELTKETLVPRGSTALLDAIGRTINSTGDALSAMPEADRPGKVLFIIITDGQENASKEFSREKVFDMISHQKSTYSWEFIFLAANQDAIASGATIGIGATNSMSFAANAQGTRSSYASLGANVRNYRTGTTSTAEFTQQDRDDQAKAGAAS
jgi:hypothetical protein